MAPRFIPTALPIAARLPDLPRAQPPPLPGSRDLDRLGTGADYRSHRLTGMDQLQGAPLDSWVDVVSTWVYRSMFKAPQGGQDGQSPSSGDWYVEFLDGSLVVYHGTPFDVWRDFFNSSSKGQFIYYRCKETHRPYETLRGPQRAVSAKHRKIRDVTRHEGSRAPRA